jgi:hypothetical protein
MMNRRAIPTPTPAAAPVESPWDLVCLFPMTPAAAVDVDVDVDVRVDAVEGDEPVVVADDDAGEDDVDVPPCIQLVQKPSAK